MTTKSEDEHRTEARAKSDLRARFATPIEADNPVNADVASDEAFSPLPPAERASRSDEQPDEDNGAPPAAIS